MFRDDSDDPGYLCTCPCTCSAGRQPFVAIEPTRPTRPEPPYTSPCKPGCWVTAPCGVPECRNTPEGIAKYRRGLPVHDTPQKGIRKR